MGIEPTLAAWEAAVLPLNYTRKAGKSMPEAGQDAMQATPHPIRSRTQNAPPTVKKKLASLPPFCSTVTLAPTFTSRPSSLLRTPRPRVP